MPCPTVWNRNELQQMQQQADKNKVELQACEKDVADMEKRIQQYKEQPLARVTSKLAAPDLQSACPCKVRSVDYICGADQAPDAASLLNHSALAAQPLEDMRTTSATALGSEELLTINPAPDGLVF